MGRRSWHPFYKYNGKALLIASFLMGRKMSLQVGHYVVSYAIKLKTVYIFKNKGLKQLDKLYNFDRVQI